MRKKILPSAANEIVSHLGASIIGSTLAEKITINFLKSKFIAESRFLRRLEKVQKIELENFNN